MDDISSRASTSGRRMATAKPVGTVRRGGSTSSRPSTTTPEIAPARWAGVALVIAALLGTILLAVVSPSDEQAPGLAAGDAGATAPPPATAVPDGDTRIPTAQPTIRQPRDGSVGRELDIPVTIDVPQEALASRLLSLVILRDGEEIKRIERPARGKPVTVGGVRLQPGRNELTAALAGPGGLGPASAPVVVHQDGDAPELRITAPESGTETFDSQVDLTISSEPGAVLKIRNQATKRESNETVGPSAVANVTVRLDMGRNRIVVTSTDPAGMQQEETVAVVRVDGRPKVDLTVPRQVRRADLPRRINVAIVVRDDEGDPVPDATVTFSLSGSGWATQNFEDTTNASGRSEWRPDLEASASREPVKVTVQVVANGESSDAFGEIRIS